MVLYEHKPKTNVYGVLNKNSGDEIGEIKWYPHWRQYTFFPEDGCVFSVGCLNDVNSFITDLMEDRKK